MTRKHTQTIRLADTGLAMTLLRVRPGAALSGLSGFTAGRSVLYKCLGYWDLLNIAPVKALEDAPSICGDLISRAALSGNVLRSHSEVFYGWESSPHGELTSILDMNKWPHGYPLLGLTICKIAPDVLADAKGGGTQAVERAVCELGARAGVLRGQRRDSVQVAVYGGLSWADIVVVVFGHDLPAILDAVGCLTEASSSAPGPCAVADIQASGLRQSVFLKTMTIPAVNWTWLREHQTDADTDLLAGKGGNGVSARIAVSARSGTLIETAQLVQEQLADCLVDGSGNPRLVLGRDDLEFTLSRLAPQDICDLLNLRDTLQGKVFVTHTDISGDWETACGATSMHVGETVELPASAPEPTHVKSKRIGEILTADDSVGRRVIQLLRLSERLYADPLTRDVYQDLVNCLANFADEIVNGSFLFPTTDVRGSQVDTALVSIYCDELALVIRQRARSASSVLHVYSENDVGDTSVYLKIAQAAGAVASSVLNMVDYDWHGAIITDTAEDYRRLASHLINLQHGALCHPGLWWGITHEAGHEYADARIGIPDEELELSELLKQCWKTSHDSKDIDEDGWNDATKLLLEFCADLFDLQHSFSNDWMRFTKLAWPYIQSRRYKFRDIEQHFFRLFALYVYTECLARGSTGLPDSSGWLDEMVASYREKIGGLCLESWRILLGEERMGHWLSKNLRAWWPCIERAHSIISPRSASATECEEVRSSELVVNSWMSRETPSPNVLCPHKDIIEFALWCLEGENTPTFGQEVAVILSLWSYRQQQIGAVSDFRWTVSGLSIPR